MSSSSSSSAAGADEHACDCNNSTQEDPDKEAHAELVYLDESENDQPRIFDDEIITLGQTAVLEEVDVRPGPSCRLLCTFNPVSSMPPGLSTPTLTVKAKIVDKDFATCLSDETVGKMNKVFRTSSQVFDSLVLPMYVLAAYIRLVEQQLQHKIVFYCDNSDPDNEIEAWMLCDSTVQQCFSLGCAKPCKSPR